MTKRQKLQKLLKVLTPDNTLPDFSAFDAHVNQLKSHLKDKITVKTLEQVSVELEKFKRRLDLQPLLDSMSQIESAFKENSKALYDELEIKTQELNTADEKRAKDLRDEITGLQIQITLSEEEVATVRKSIPDLTDIETRLGEMTTELSSRVDALEETEPQEVKDWTDTIEKLRKELMNRINQIGGGSMNRKITFGGVDYLTKYTDINYKAGSNVTFTVSTNDTTKMVDVTIAATGGSGSGIVRLITSISGNTNAGAASTTDYVYLVSGTTTLTLPTAVGNTNLYTVKNVGVGTVTINTTSAQTIDGSATIVMPIQYTSVDLVSDTANWSVT